MGSIWKKIRQAMEDKMPWFNTRMKCLPDGGVTCFSEMSGGVARTVDGAGEEDNKTTDARRQLKLTRQHQDQSARTSEQHSSKESSIAIVLPQQPGEEQQHTPDLITPTDEKVEVIKVYLETRQQKDETHQESLKMLTDEVSQIQEVRYCLKTLREQMAARQSSNNNNKYPANGYKVSMPSTQPNITNGNIVQTDSEPHAGDNQEETLRLREATKRLYAQLKELEKRHQEERDRLQAESSEYRRRLDEQTELLQRAEEQSEERGQQVEELQRLLTGMELESTALKDKLATGEEELLQLRAGEERGQEKEQRCEKLEKELATLKEKIHHLDDMLKSQQRKVRHMIEQLQNSRTVIQERDRVIMDLEERVAFLEAENRELHDRMEHFLDGENALPLTSTENKPQVIYSKPLTPSTHSNKSLPFIKVIEIKS
ncbi:tuftelin 1b isoform X1 [Myripristis murdjan]|uniref:tuftelin 1b isoform X1 n=2 Tax=Myripristis murdjan TaxID=586833 RepID=UPI001175D455|nr:tuftelin-like isoform X1 [Myripristis murdjan]